MSVLFLLSLFLLLFASNGSHIDPSRVTQLLWKPRAFLYKGFLSDEECDHLILLANDKLDVTMVADDESGESVLSDSRTSSGMFLDQNQLDETVSRIEQRIAAWTFLPIENGEAIQILRYQKDQKYEPHPDYFFDLSIERGGQRTATVLMYLSNVTKGGETVFPYVKKPKNNHSSSDCGNLGFAVKPCKGDALLFFSLTIDGTPDPASVHGSCPVMEGEKWSATKWIHVKSFK